MIRCLGFIQTGFVISCLLINNSFSFKLSFDFLVIQNAVEFTLTEKQLWLQRKWRSKGMSTRYLLRGRDKRYWFLRMVHVETLSQARMLKSPISILSIKQHPERHNFLKAKYEWTFRLEKRNINRRQLKHTKGDLAELNL